MIRSMTGWGEAERPSPVGRLRLEVKTVNHRYFNTSIKTPPGFDRFEREISEVLKRSLTRGHVNAYLSVDRAALGAEAPPRVDVARAREILGGLRALAAELEVPGEVDLATLARFGEIFRAGDHDDVRALPVELVRELTEEAALAARAFREREGARLEADLRARLQAMESLLGEVERRAPERLTAERDRLRAAVRELTQQVEVDEDRLAREIAYLAERWDIHEELVRFRAHIAQFTAALDAEGDEAVGKRLSFLAQEMLREANTIASKANDAVIAHAAVALKEEIERLREQVENVE